MLSHVKSLYRTFGHIVSLFESIYIYIYIYTNGFTLYTACTASIYIYIYANIDIL